MTPHVHTHSYTHTHTHTHHVHTHTQCTPKHSCTVKEEVKQTLVLLEDLSSFVTHEHSRSKSMLFKAISPSVNFAISLFPVYLTHADILDFLMGFFLSLFDAMKAQVGPVLTERTTQTFMTLLTKEHLRETLQHEGSLECRVVEK